MNHTTLYFDTLEAAQKVYRESNDRPDVTSCPPIRVHAQDDTTGQIVERWAIALTHWPLD